MKLLFGLLLLTSTFVILGQKAPIKVPPPIQTRIPIPPRLHPDAGAKALQLITSIAFSPDGKYLAVGGYKQVALFDTKNWKVESTFFHVQDYARAIAFYPDSKQLVVGSGLPARTGEIRTWDISDPEKFMSFPPQKDTIESIAVQRDGKQILVAGNDSKVHFYPNLPKTYGPTLDEHNGRVTAVAFPQQPFPVFVTGAMDKVVKVWDANTVKNVLNFDQATAGITSDASSCSASESSSRKCWSMTRSMPSLDMSRIRSAIWSGVPTSQLSAAALSTSSASRPW